MKKVFALLFGLFITTNAHAVLLDVPPFISVNDVTIAHLEELRADTANVLNGLVEGGGINIKAGSLNTQDFADAVSIVTFRDEAFNDFTFSGMLPSTDSDLSSDISAGISYVEGFRISKNAESRTYTASKDNYVYIHKDGYYVVSEVANGASAPSTPANTLLLAKVVTSGTAVTSVSDLRTTSIQINVTTSNFPQDFRNQAYISRDTSTTMHVEAGAISIGTSIYTRTSDTSSKTITTSSNWIEGSAPNLTTGQLAFVYAYNDSGTTWDFKFSSADPVYSDTSSNSGGALKYYTTGGVWYRALGWAYFSADAVQPYAFSDFTDTTTRNKVTYMDATFRALSSQIPLDNTTPTTSEGTEIGRILFRPSHPNAKIKIMGSINVGPNTADTMVGTLFLNSEARPLNARACNLGASDSSVLTVNADYVPGTTSLMTLKWRVGRAAGGAWDYNGQDGSALFNTGNYSIFTVEEVA